MHPTADPSRLRPIYRQFPVFTESQTSERLTQFLSATDLIDHSSLCATNIALELLSLLLYSS